MTLPPDDLEEARICAARLSPLGLARYMFRARKGYEFIVASHHHVISDALMRVYLGLTTRLIINIPPRYSKTELAVVMFIAWCLGHDPDSEFIHTSYTGGLANNNAFAAKQIVESEEYARIFPGVALRTDSKAKGDWRTTAGGVVYSQGSGGTITGFGAGKLREGFGGAILVDDPHKPAEAGSETMRKNVIEWFGNTLESRKNSPQTPIVLIMQRLHEADLSGFLLAGGNGETWEHIGLPALREDGTALWPAKHSVETLRVMQRANPYVFAGQYQQRPAPLEGGEFKPDMIGVIEAIPAGTRFVRAWDMAGTEAGGDWTAGALLGQMPDGRYLIADMVRVQEDPEVALATMKATASRDGTGIPQAIPQDPGQAGKAQIRSVTRALAGYTVQSKPVSGDKVLRARPCAAQVNVGNVVMLRGDWNKAMTDEMRNFPNGLHDDQVDGLSLAFDSLTDNKLGVLDFYKAEADERKRLQASAAAPSVTKHEWAV